MHIGTNNLVEPSIANSTYSGVFTFQPVDFNISAAALFETLGTKKAKGFDGVWIESYEQPV
jgi:hypothetical protein